MTVDIDRLLDAASTATGGLDDFGDPSFRVGLQRFMDSGLDEGHLTEIGAAALEGMAIGNLITRLRVLDWHASHPELRDTVIERPIFLIGLPRTGTTALSHLLSVDPANRSLLQWEVNDPVPPASRDWRNDPRFLAAMDAPNALDLLNPEFKSIHHDPMDMPVECATLLGQHFMSLHLPTTFCLPTYMTELFDTDHTAAYEYHRSVLQVMQSGWSGRWQLKSPVHLVDPWALAAVYPDARFVLTHRDPLTVIASVCSLVKSLSGTWTDHDWTDYIRTTWPEVVATLLDDQNAFRDELTAAGRGDAFVDVAYRDLVSDPIATVGSIYDALGETLTDSAVEAMTRHTAEHRKDRFGAHRYSLSDWDLDPGALTERCEPYLTRYAEFLER